MLPAPRGSAFVNCPFDDAFKPLFDAIVFACIACRFKVRSALEVSDSGELRLEKIYRLIGEATHSIHDLSRVEVDDDSGLPRFNMPIELGIALGHKRFARRARKPRLLVMDSERYRYQRFASDLAGLDIASHGGEPARVIACVRAFLSPEAADLPTADQIGILYAGFEAQLPSLAASKRQTPEKLVFLDRMRLAEQFVATAITA